MNMHHVELDDRLPQTTPKGRGPPQPPKKWHAKIVNRHSVQHYRPVERHIEVRATVYVGGVHMHIVPTARERGGETVH
jgi:hypothetical protein